MNYKRHYSLLINRAGNRLLEDYTEKHHIIPKCMNGSNEKNNIVILTAREHFVAHLLLAKIHGGKLWHAAWLMSNNKRYSSRTYKWLRENHAIEISKKLTGRKQSEEHKRKRSNSLKGNTNGTAHKGRTLSEKHKQKISEKLIGIPKAKEHKKNMSKSAKGKPKAEGHKKAISEAIILHRARLLILKNCQGMS